MNDRHASRLLALLAALTFTLSACDDSDDSDATALQARFSANASDCLSGACSTADRTVAFTNASTGGAASFAWSFGDGDTSTQENPTHSYERAGEYTVSLTVTNADGSESHGLTATLTVDSPDAAIASILVNGSGWRVADLTANVQVPILGTIPVSVFDNTDEFDCILDDVFTYLQDGTLTSDQGAVACVESAPQTVNGTWSLNQTADTLYVSGPGDILPFELPETAPQGAPLPLSSISASAIESNLVVELPEPLEVDVEGFTITLETLDLTLRFEPVP